MNIGHLVVKEIKHRKLSFFLGLFSVSMATAMLVAPYSLLQVHDQCTNRIMQAKEDALEVRLDDLNDQIRRTMLKLGFNIVILPKDQDLAEWYAHGEGHATMPEEYAGILAKTDIMVVQHLLPSLQQRLTWPETKRNIILVGTRGEEPRSNTNLKQLRDPVEVGTLVLGFELQQSLSLKVGDEVILMGRSFRVSKCHEARGSRDDITVWVNLSDAQAILNKPGKINAIMALQCNCPNSDLESIRQQVAQILPDTQVIERKSKALARAEARAEIRSRGHKALADEREHRERLRQERHMLATILVPLVLLACTIWIGITTFSNVRERRTEIGILRAFGLRSSKITSLFLFRALVMGMVGGPLGCIIGSLAGSRLGMLLDKTDALALPFIRPAVLLASLALACLLALLASWIPAVIATQQDPADILREE